MISFISLMLRRVGNSVFISRMRKLRPKECVWLAKGHTSYVHHYYCMIPWLVNKNAHEHNILGFVFLEVLLICSRLVFALYERNLFISLKFDIHVKCSGMHVVLLLNDRYYSNRVTYNFLALHWITSGESSEDQGWVFTEQKLRWHVWSQQSVVIQIMDLGIDLDFKVLLNSIAS